MDLGRGLRALRAGGRAAAAHGPRYVRAHALVRGAGKPPQQPRYGDLLRRRQGPRHVLRPEPLLRAVRRPLPGGFDAPHPPRRTRGAADRRGAHRHRGRALPQPFGYRHPLAGACGREDRAAAEYLPGRRFDHHAAVGQEPLPARYGPQPRADRAHGEARDGETQGVDHGPQTRIQLHQGGDRRDVPQYGGVRFERLRHQVGGPYVLQQGAARAQRPGGGGARGGGERPDALLAGAEPGQCAGPPQSGACGA